MIITFLAILQTPCKKSLLLYLNIGQLIRMQQCITCTGLLYRTVLKSTYTCYITGNPYYL